MKKYLAILLGILLSGTSLAQVKNFTLKNAVTGENISLETYPSCSGLVIIFTSNVCPYDEYYRTRVRNLSLKYSDKIPVLLINSGVESGESLEEMAKKAKSWGLNLPYLADKDQAVLKDFGATKTPQVYLLKNSGGKFTIFYSGAIDDNAQVESDVKSSYLRDAIEILLANHTIATPEIRPVGCILRKQ